MKNCIHSIECFPSLQKTLSPQQNGEMIPLFHGDESSFNISYVYAMTLFPRTLKGPYQHKKRSAKLYLLSGKALLVHRDPKIGIYCEDYLVPTSTVFLPVEEEYCLIGMGQDVSMFINLCDHPWRPAELETTVPNFSDYDFSKWGLK